MTSTPCDALDYDCPVGASQRKAEDAIDGLALIISTFDDEQRGLMSEMHMEIQLLFSMFILSVRGSG